jgi:hypothetical protein
MLNIYKIYRDKAGEGGSAGGTGSSGTAGGDKGGGSGDAGGSGGAGSGGNNSGDKEVVTDPLLGDAGGGGKGTGVGGGSGGGDKGGSQGAGGDKSGDAGGGAGQVVIPQNWKEALPEEIRGEASLTNVPDVPTLVKNYINAQKMIGADKVAIPGKHASENDWKEVYYKLGLPRDSKEYNVELDPKTNLDKDFVETFKGKAHEIGLMPNQAKKMAEWFGKINTEVNAEADKQNRQAVINQMNGLKKEWGNDYEQNIIRARAAIMEFADDGMKKFIKDAGLTTNPAFIKLMTKVGETLSEDTLKSHSVSQNANELSPAQANEKIAEIKANAKHPYWNPEHENHLAAKKEMNQLFEWANPRKTS